MARARGGMVGRRRRASGAEIGRKDSGRWSQATSPSWTGCGRRRATFRPTLLVPRTSDSASSAGFRDGKTCRRIRRSGDAPLAPLSFSPPRSPPWRPLHRHARLSSGRQSSSRTSLPQRRFGGRACMRGSASCGRVQPRRSRASRWRRARAGSGSSAAQGRYASPTRGPTTRAAPGSGPRAL